MPGFSTFRFFAENGEVHSLKRETLLAVWQKRIMKNV